MAKCRRQVMEWMDGGVVDGAPENIGAQKAILTFQPFDFQGGELAIQAGSFSRRLSHDL